MYTVSVRKLTSLPFFLFLFSPSFFFLSFFLYIFFNLLIQFFLRTKSPCANAFGYCIITFHWTYCKNIRLFMCLWKWKAIISVSVSKM